MSTGEDSSFSLDCDPSKILDFQLEDGAEPSECPLHLSNPGSSSVAFKVKTTKPKRYLVRPNQGVVGPSERLAVSIVLLAQDKTELLQQYRQTGTCNDTNKFMLQALPLEGTTATTPIVSTQVWEQAKARVQQKKLIVRFGFPKPGTRAAPAGGGNLKQMANGIKTYVSAGGVRKRPSGGGEEGSALGQDAAAATVGEGGSDGSGTANDKIWVQATELRQKYDDLVSFTINLTAEKDLIFRSLNATKDELAREQKARKELQTQMMEPGARRSTSANGVGANSAEKSSGFSLFFVLLVAVAALLFGQWMSPRYPLFNF